MHRTTGDANVANLFDEGDPDEPRQPTQIDASWLNDVQEEICNVIEAASITLVEGTRTQLLSALRTATRVNQTLAANWTGDGVTFALPRAYKDVLGRVTLEGAASHASNGTNVTMFTLASGFRPPVNMTFLAQLADSKVCKVSIVASSGDVVIGAINGESISTNSVHLDGITFHV